MKLVGAALAAGALMTGSGCAYDGADSQAEEETAATPSDPVAFSATREVASVAVDGAKVTFYEVEEGGVFAVERGELKQRRVPGEHERGLTMSELYEHLAGQPAPQALLQAEERDPSTSRNRAAREDVSATEPTAANTRTEKELGIDTDYFYRFLCDVWGGNVGNKKAIYYDVSGYANTGSWNDIHEMRSAVNAHRGSIVHQVLRRPLYTWKYLLDEPVPPGQYSSIHYGISGFDFDGQARVQVSGDNHYDFCAMGRNWLIVTQI
jgi:hypothetical protein